MRCRSETAIHMLTRFHNMWNMNVAIDEVRRAEAAKMRTDASELILTNARWSLRWTAPRTRRSDGTDSSMKPLKNVRTHLLRELFQQY